ncbi:hypothetical protein Aglo01_38440 [Actinokineospora globicatena]|nr:hypothetical protein Aglo01_38440 [Actinokineospora globicatena]GLW86228.1 hypothetical protein Aglo02_38670 [Actinokineospora globicatena]
MWRAGAAWGGEWGSVPAAGVFLGDGASARCTAGPGISTGLLRVAGETIASGAAPPVATSSGPRGADSVPGARTTPCATPDGAEWDTECAISPTTDGSPHDDKVERNASPSETDTPSRTETGVRGGTDRQPPSQGGWVVVRFGVRKRSQMDTALTPLR